MSITTKHIVIGLVSFGVGIFIGILIRPTPLATVSVTNSSHKNIQAVYITIDSTTYFINNIEQYKNKSSNIFVKGEGEFKIKVMFVNGDSLESHAYVESGYKVYTVASDFDIVFRVHTR